MASLQVDDRLIYDIGFHKGEDTVHYLKKGFKVIAVEANPILVEEGNKKFNEAISQKKLAILNVGIADKEGTLPFYRNHHQSVWSSFNKIQGTRNNTPYDVIDVRCVTTQSLFEEYNVPYYLKVDIEGYDYYCINDLPSENLVPTYISCEANDIEYLTVLKNKGYSKFKIINQANRFKPLNLAQEHNWLFGKYLFVSEGVRMRLEKFIPATHLHGSSGPFAEDSLGSWKSYEEAYGEFDSFIHHKDYHRYNQTSWFDFHAKL